MSSHANEGYQDKYNLDSFTGWWRETRDSMRSWWEKLSNEDIEYIAGRKDRLVELLQEKYGYGREKALEEIERYMKETSSHIENVATNVRQSIEETAAYVAKQAGEAKDALGSTAEGLAEAAAGQVKTAAVGVGGQIQSLASGIRESAPQSGAIASAATGAADRMESAGRYLQQNDLSIMTQDLANLVRRYPLRCLLLGVGVGYFLMRRKGR